MGRFVADAVLLIPLWFFSKLFSHHRSFGFKIVVMANRKEVGRKCINMKNSFCSWFFFEQKREYLNTVTFIIFTEFVNMIEHTEYILCLIDCVCFLSVICNECILLFLKLFTTWISCFFILHKKYDLFSFGCMYPLKSLCSSKQSDYSINYVRYIITSIKK